MNKCLLCEELYKDDRDTWSGYCSKICRQIDTVDLNVNEENSYLENQWNDKK